MLTSMQVADLFFVHQRGTMNGIYLSVVIIGNYVSVPFCASTEANRPKAR